MYTLLAEEINKAGGIGGKPIQLFTEDDQTNPDAGVRGARKLVDVNKVHAILGTWSSAVTLAVAPIAVQAKIPQFCVSSSPVISTFKDDDFLYRTAYSQAVICQRLRGDGAEARLQDGRAADPQQPLRHRARRQLPRPVRQGRRQGHGQGHLQPEPVELPLGDPAGAGRQAGRHPLRRLHAGRHPGLQGVVPARPRRHLDGPGLRVRPEVRAGHRRAGGRGHHRRRGRAQPQSSAYKNADKLFRAAHKEEADFFASMAYDHLMVVALSVLAAKGDTSGDAIKGNIRKITNPPGKVVGSWAEASPW